MASRKTNEEKLQEVEKKLQQLQNQKKTLLQKQKQEERKARTRRLIQIGALAEKYLHCEGIEPAAFEKMLQKMVSEKNDENVVEDSLSNATERA